MCSRASDTLKFFDSKTVFVVSVVAHALENASKISSFTLIVVATVVGCQQCEIAGNDGILRGTQSVRYTRAPASPHLLLPLPPFLGSHNTASNPTRLACCDTHALRYLRPNEA